MRNVNENNRTDVELMWYHLDTSEAKYDHILRSFQVLF